MVELPIGRTTFATAGGSARLVLGRRRAGCFGQGGDHPGPLLVVSPDDRLADVDVVHWNGRTSIFRLHAFDPSAASLSTTSRPGGLEDPEAGEELL
jgi:hypothetical protein